MGVFSENNPCDSHKNLNNVKNIKLKKDSNEDFKRLNDLIGNLESLNKFKISNIFKFLKIDNLFLGLQNMEKIYNEYQAEFKKRNLSKKDSVHASLLFSFSNNCNYFIDYFPASSNSDFIPFYPNETKGLRYKEMTIEDFIRFNSVCIIKLKSNKGITLYNLFEKIYSDNKWKYENYDLEKNNCCHFAEYILKILDSKLLTENIIEDILFTEYIENSQKENSINSLIPKMFLIIFTKNSDNLNKLF